MLAVTWYASASLQSFYLQHMKHDLVARAYLVEKRVAGFLDAEQRNSLEISNLSVGFLARWAV